MRRTNNNRNYCIFGVVGNRELTVANARGGGDEDHPTIFVRSLHSYFLQLPHTPSFFDS